MLYSLYQFKGENMGARKGLKHKTHSKEVKLEILAKLETNQSHLSIARE